MADAAKAMASADKIVVLNGGQIAQVGAPMSLYETPANLFVAGFIGSPNMKTFNASATGGNVSIESVSSNSADAGTSDVKAAITVANSAHEGPLKLGVRPEHLQATTIETAAICPRFELVEQLCEYALAHLSMPDETMTTAKLNRSSNIAIGEVLPLRFDSANAHLFSAADGKRI